MSYDSFTLSSNKKSFKNYMMHYFVLIFFGLVLSISAENDNISKDRFLPGITSKISPKKNIRPDNIPSDKILEESGAIIGKIIIICENMFDSTSEEDNAKTFRFVNKVHFKTKEFVIKKTIIV